MGITDAWEEAITEEELARFALVLEECERIRAMIAQDEEAAALRSDASGGIPIVAARTEEQVPELALTAAA